MIYNIDIAGTCNLRCPSCPVGNHDQQGYGLKRKSGFMDIQMFEDILTKIGLEDSEPEIHLYNWGEPLLHPKYAEIVKLVMDRGWFCGVSTNLSHENIDMRMVAKHLPNHFRVSLSGFYQDIYSKGHRNGQVSLVKSNLYKLHHAIIKQHGFEFLSRLEVCYHVYKDNVENDLFMMYSLCQELGYSFAPRWAILMPLEGMLDYLSGNAKEDMVRLDERLLISVQEGMEIAKRNPLHDCPLRSNQTAINHDGSVSLCCTVYDEENNISSSFLQTPIQDLQRMKYAHKLCQTCMNYNLHSLAVSNGLNDWNKTGNQILSKLNAPYIINQNQNPPLDNRS
ncbi:MAG: radical SAM protein [Methylococcales bacterium]